MDIAEIASKLNKLTFKDKTPFSNLQKIRFKYLKKRPNTWRIFSSKSIKWNYAFHSGGRKEFQFNIGEDWLEGKTVFRYGLAFSLNEDKTLHDSKAEFRPKINRFNNFILTNPHFFSGFSMWYYSDGSFVEFYDNVKAIDDHMFQAENFIFIGNFFSKQINDIDTDDIEQILLCFDRLIEVYEKVEFGDVTVEKRIARLTWNTNGWVNPSGPLGKSKNKDTHEGQYGYGHEEWLFETSKLIDGYHYGFLEPIRQQQSAYMSNTYTIWLYTIDHVTKKRYWIGEIDNIEVITVDEADRIKDIYIQRNWHDEMENQIRESGANTKGFSNWRGVDLFNVRFLPKNLRLNADYCELPKDSKIYNLTRYTFGKFSEDLIPDTITKGFEFPTILKKSDKINIDNTVESSFYDRIAKPIEVQYVHKAIANGLKSLLKSKYGENNVHDELRAGYGNNKIDMVVKLEDEFIFYEIKSYNSSRTSIREALGQLLEYSCWVSNNNATKLVIVSQKLGDTEEAKKYIYHLRNTFNLPVYFQTFDLDSLELSEEF